MKISSLGSFQALFVLVEESQRLEFYIPDLANLRRYLETKVLRRFCNFRGAVRLAPIRGSLRDYPYKRVNGIAVIQSITLTEMNPVYLTDS